MGGIDDESRVGDEPQPAHGVLVACPPFGTVAVVAREKRDPTMAVLGEMSDGELDASAVVRDDGRSVRAAREVDDRMPALLHASRVRDRLLCRQRVDHDQPVRVPRADGGERPVRAGGRPRRTRARGSRAGGERRDQVDLLPPRDRRQARDQRLEIQIHVAAVDLPAVQDAERRATPAIARPRSARASARARGM